MICQGATIVDQQVCITRWGTYTDEDDLWNSSPCNHEGNSGSSVCMRNFNSQLNWVKVTLFLSAALASCELFKVDI